MVVSETSLGQISWLPQDKSLPNCLRSGCRRGCSKRLWLWTLTSARSATSRRLITFGFRSTTAGLPKCLVWRLDFCDSLSYGDWGCACSVVGHTINRTYFERFKASQGWQSLIIIFKDKCSRFLDNCSSHRPNTLTRALAELGCCVDILPVSCLRLAAMSLRLRFSRISSWQ